MTDTLRITLLYSLVPVVLTILGATLGAFWPVIARRRSYVLHLAAGVVFAVVAVELLPEIQRRAAVGGAPVRDVVLGFALGIGTMLGVDRVLDRIRGEDDDDDEDAGGGARADTRAAPSAARPTGVGVSLLVAVGPSAAAGSAPSGRERLQHPADAPAHQQAVVAALGVRALRGMPLATLLQEAADVVARTLGTEFVKVVELLPDGQTARVVAGVG